MSKLIPSYYAADMMIDKERMKSASLEDLERLSSSLQSHGSLPTEAQEPSTTSVNSWFNSSNEIAMKDGRSPINVHHHGSTHAKHRRTRSGCLTCRTRRIKCDESRPICDRCRKCSRSCEYPQPRSKSASKLGEHRASKHNSGSSSDEYDVEEMRNDPLRSKEQQTTEEVQKSITKSQKFSSKCAVVASKTEDLSSNQQYQSFSEPIDQFPEATLSVPSKDFNPIAASYVPLANPRPSASTSTEGLLDDSQWSCLPLDHQALLTYHQTYLTYHHYFFKHEANYFIHNTLLKHALSYEPLRFAVVGFAAFHLALREKHSMILDFLDYYNTAINLLRRSLATDEKHTDATIMAILQLATFEEYLGDWSNVLEHQKAAYAMLIELYDVASIMNIEVRRKILAWYSRFDLFAGLMSGYETVLGKEWFCANESYYQLQSRKNPSSMNCKIEAAIASYRVLAMDMALLFAKLPRGEITVESFNRENSLIAEHLRTWRQNLDPLVNDGRYLVHSFQAPRERDPDDIVDPYLPRGLYKGELWTINFLLMDWIALDVMQKYQTAVMFKQRPPSELKIMALELCRLFEAIEYWPESPSGSVLKAQAGLGIAALFLPRDQRHVMWCRRKMAMIEGTGYILPTSFRNKMAELWGIPDVRLWWLPEGQGFSSIIRSIRSIVENRSPQNPNPSKSEDVRNMKAIVATMSVSDDHGNGTTIKARHKV